MKRKGSGKGSARPLGNPAKDKTQPCNTEWTDRKNEGHICGLPKGHGGAHLCMCGASQ